MANLGAIVEASGSSWEKVVKTTILLVGAAQRALQAGALWVLRIRLSAPHTAAPPAPPPARRRPPPPPPRAAARGLPALSFRCPAAARRRERQRCADRRHPCPFLPSCLASL